MSIIRGQLDRKTGRLDGEVAKVSGAQRRYSRSEIRQIRQGRMLRLRLDGWHTDDIAALYKCTPQHVCFEIRDLPTWLRQDIEEQHSRGKLRLA